MLATTAPWTYWMVIPLFVAVALAMVAVLVGCYRKVLLPAYGWWLYQLSTDAGDPTSRPALRLVEGGGMGAGRDSAQVRRAA